MSQIDEFLARPVDLSGMNYANVNPEFYLL